MYIEVVFRYTCDDVMMTSNYNKMGPIQTHYDTINSMSMKKKMAYFCFILIETKKIVIEELSE